MYIWMFMYDIIFAHADALQILLIVLYFLIYSPG